jgi:NAD(P)-dependent dehydrogenase (short-subunit alcohol dehydrogenase family)
MRPIALIAGASAGIGAELARVFAAHGHELVLVARRADRLSALAEEIAAGGKSRPIVLGLDLEKRDAVSNLAAELAVRGVEPQFVVNNAGFGLLGTAAALPRDGQLAMIDLNVRALIRLPSLTVWRVTAAASSTLLRLPRSCRGPAWQFIMQARPTCFHSAKPCTKSSRLAVSGSPRSVLGRCRPNFRRGPLRPIIPT